VGVFTFAQSARKMAESGDFGQIIIGCKKGEAACFSQIVDMYAGRCYGYFYRLTGNTAVSDDLLGELFVKLVEKIGSYKGGSFESWLFRIASNIFHDHLRDGPKWSDDTDERIDKVQQQLEKLDTDTRELVILRFYSELSFKEIAKIRSEPIGTTLSKLHRAAKKLRQLME